MTYILKVDAAFTEKEVDLMRSACRRWQAVTKNAVRFELVSNQNLDEVDPIGLVLDKAYFREEVWRSYSADGKTQTVIVWKLKEDDIRFPVLELLIGPAFDGFTHGHLIAIVESDDLERLETTTVHELGHLIGINHLKGIMSETANRNCITQLDIMAWCETAKCDPNGLTPECR